MPFTVGTMISRITRLWTSGVTTGAGEYAPMPPVLGPWSPSKMRLWSWLEGRASPLRAMARVAELVAGEHHVDRVVRFLRARGDDHALARGEAIGLDDDGGAEAID